MVSLTFTGTAEWRNRCIPPVPRPTPYDRHSGRVEHIDLGVSGLPGSANGGGARDLGVGDDPVASSAMVIAAFHRRHQLQLPVAGMPRQTVPVHQVLGTTMWTWQQLLRLRWWLVPSLPTSTFPALYLDRLCRFLKLNFISVGTHSTGTIECNIVLDRDDQIMGIGGAYSGYPAGPHGCQLQRSPCHDSARFSFTGTVAGFALLRHIAVNLC